MESDAAGDYGGGMLANGCSVHRGVTADYPCRPPRAHENSKRAEMGPAVPQAAAAAQQQAEARRVEASRLLCRLRENPAYANTHPAAQAVAAAQQQAEAARAEAARAKARERAMRGAYADIQGIMAALPPPTPRCGSRAATPPAPWCASAQARSRKHDHCLVLLSGILHCL